MILYLNIKGTVNLPNPLIYPNYLTEDPPVGYASKQLCCGNKYLNPIKATTLPFLSQ